MAQTLPELRRSRGSSDPFNELEQMTERMRQMLGQTFGGIGFEPSQRHDWSPFVDLEETDDSYVVEVEVPGVKREDITVELVGSELEIHGECKEREHTGEMRKQTRRSGRFAYRVTLPDHVESGKIDARLSDGVLTIHVPKAERAQRQQIEVKS